MEETVGATNVQILTIALYKKLLTTALKEKSETEFTKFTSNINYILLFILKNKEPQ